MGRRERVGAMDRLTVLCFGGTYGLALASELARFVVRGARMVLDRRPDRLAWLVQTAYLVNLAWDRAQEFR